MTGYLLDTNVISETRKVRPHGGVVAWLGAMRAEQIHFPVLVFGEIQSGIERIRHRDPHRAGQLETWLSGLEREPRILALNAECFRTWARMMYKNLLMSGWMRRLPRLPAFTG